MLAFLSCSAHLLHWRMPRRMERRNQSRCRVDRPTEEFDYMPLLEINQELMTPDEAAKWFRRSPSWLRQQHELLRVGGPGGQPLYHVRVCRAYVLAKLCRLGGTPLRRVQIEALCAACGLPINDAMIAYADSAESTIEIPTELAAATC